MKKFNEFLLEGATTLSNEAMQSIKGGIKFTCFCGFVGGPYEDQTVTVTASSVGEALNSMNCGGYGATCNGPQQ